MGIYSVPLYHYFVNDTTYKIPKNEENAYLSFQTDIKKYYYV